MLLYPLWDISDILYIYITTTKCPYLRTKTKVHSLSFMKYFVMAETICNCCHTARGFLVWMTLSQKWESCGVHKLLYFVKKLLFQWPEPPQATSAPPNFLWKAFLNCGGIFWRTSSHDRLWCCGRGWETTVWVEASLAECLLRGGHDSGGGRSERWGDSGGEERLWRVPWQSVNIAGPQTSQQPICSLVMSR